VLDLVGDITNGHAPCPFYSMLRQPTEEFSKLLLLIGQLRKDPVLLGSYTASPGASTRNVFEALWGADESESVLQRDAHHRVAIMGWWFTAGRPTALGQLERLMKHDCPLWRAAAVCLSARSEARARLRAQSANR
jgi:hypothetical protein